MRATWILVAVILTAGLALRERSAGASPRAGKVVRVPRAPAGFPGLPRYCAVHPGDLFGHCIGTKAPEIGDRMTAIDHHRVLGVLRVTRVEPYADTCQRVNQWMIQTVVDSGDIRSSRGAVLALSDVPVDPRHARLIHVDHTPTGHPIGADTIFAIDNNADGNADLEFVQYACDDFGNPSVTAATSHCHEVWAAQPGRGFTRLRHDRYRICN